MIFSISRTQFAPTYFVFSLTYSLDPVYCALHFSYFCGTQNISEFFKYRIEVKKNSRSLSPFNSFYGISFVNRHRHKTSNSLELLELMKYDPFLIFWWIFCRNLQKIEYENEVCFEASRMPNFFELFYDSLKK